MYTCNKLKTPHYFCDMFHKLLLSIWCLPDKQGKCCAFHLHNRDTVITEACKISKTVDKHTDTCSQKQKCFINVRKCVWMWIPILFQWLRSCILLRWTYSYTVSNLRSTNNSKLGQFQYISRTCIKATFWTRAGE